MKIEKIGSFWRIGDYATQKKIRDVRLLDEHTIFLQIKEDNEILWTTVALFNTISEARQAMTLLLQAFNKEP